MDIDTAKQAIATDFQGLQKLKVTAKNTPRKAIEAAAKQFESIFLKRMIESMRKANDFLSDSNPLKSKRMRFFEDMLDQQRALDMANRNGIGLADTLIQQLDRLTPKSTKGASTSEPASHFPIPNKTNNNTLAGTPLPKGNFESLVQQLKQTPPLNHPSIEFVKQVWPMAKEAAKAIGLDPKLLVAQAAHETGWGQHMIKDELGQSANNLFNIKSSPDAKDSVETETHEYINHKKVLMKDSFRKYGSIEQSFNDYVNLVKSNPRYQNALMHSDNARQYIQELQKAGYATDPMYAENILKIYDGNTLNQSMKQLEVQ